MNRVRFLFSVAAAAAAVALFSSPADAGWGSFGSHGSHGSYGSSGYSSYGSSGSSGYASYRSHGSSGYASYSSHGSSGYASAGSSGGSYRRVGLLQRIRQHFHAKRARFHSSGGSSGYSSYYGSGGSSGYTTSYGASSGGSSGYSASHGGSSGSPVIYHSARNQVSGPTYYSADAGSAEPASSTVNASVAADTALLTVSVPEAARVTVNGHETTSTGPVRQFMSKGLQAGYQYSYDIAVETEIDGETVTERQTVSVRAGQAERLVFDPAANRGVQTALTLHVPEDAEVTLAGNATAATGQVRTYRTSQLRAGETWNDYAIEVAVTQNGQRVVKQKTIALKAGSEQELEFAFTAPADAVVAAR